MTTRICFAASPFTSGTQIALQTREACRRQPHGSLSLLARASDVHGLCLPRPTRPNSEQSLATNDAVEGTPREAAELQMSLQKAAEPIKLQDLRMDCIYKGKVSVIESYGVFVDIGACTDGFIHISRLGRPFVRSVEDVVKVGEDVYVQIVDLDRRTNSISLLLRDEGFVKNVGLLALTLPEEEVVNRAAARRANKLAKREDNPLPRRVMSLETRRQLKAYRRSVLAERQAIQLHQVRSRDRILNDFDELDDISKAKC